MRVRMGRWLPWLALGVVIVGFANFFWFLAESSAIGGDALNGYIRDGRYFLNSHGDATEVTQATWYWSRAHAISVFGTHLVAMAGMGFLMFRVFFPAMLPSRSPADESDRLEAVRASGPAVASGRCAGQLGELRLSGPLLDVAVHPGGITFTPPFMSPVVLLAKELEGVGWDRRWGQSRMTIGLRPGAWLGPIRLYLGPNDQLAVAIEHLVPDRGGSQEQTKGPAGVTPSPARFGKYPLIMKVWLVGALVFSVPFLLSIAEPGLNLPFLFGLVIIGANVYWFLIRDRHRW